MTVYLVGAGPGDPGLLTVRGFAVLTSADVVVYDRLASPTLLEVVPAGAELISAGKAPGRVDMNQDEINAVLVDRGKTAKTVVRLKGGDPFVFGRGGEEAEALAAAGIPYEVVPGVTSAIGALAYGGIPITHRGVSTHFTVVTGHEDPAKGTTDVDWDALARVGGTLVILMGAGKIGDIAQRLIDGGLDAATPVAAVRNGTRPDQHTVRATLATIGDAGVKAPSAIVVGDVAALDLSWFESRPLFGRSVVVTRAREQASELRARLDALGADVIELPTISIEPLDFTMPVLTDVGWLVFTSVNGVDAFFDRGLDPAGLDTRALAGVKIAAIGPSTERALLARGIRVDITPERSVAESLLDAFPDPAVDGERRAARARGAGPRRAARGAHGTRLRRRRAPRVPHGARGARRRCARPRARGRRRRDHVHVVVDRRQPVRRDGHRARPTAGGGVDRPRDVGESRVPAASASTSKPPITPSTASSPPSSRFWRRKAPPEVRVSDAKTGRG